MVQRFKAWLPVDVVNFRLFIAGNEEGFTYLYKQLYKPSFYFATGLLENNLDIGCIVNDAFLYVWKNRERFKNLNHFYSSIKLYIKYRCIGYWTNNSKKNASLQDFYRTQQVSVYDPELEVIDRMDGSYTDELVVLLENAMPYLPATRRNILQLYQKGVSPKKISKLLGISSHKVTSETKKSIRSLKLIMPTLQKAHQAGQNTRKVPVANYEAYLNKQQARICTLYYKNKLPFSSISRELGLAPFELLKEHYAAMAILNSVKTN